MNSIDKVFEKFEKKHNLEEYYQYNMGVMIPVKEINQLKSEIQEIHENTIKAIFDDIEKLDSEEILLFKDNAIVKKYEELKKKWCKS